MNCQVYVFVVCQPLKKQNQKKNPNKQNKNKKPNKKYVQ